MDFNFSGNWIDLLLILAIFYFVSQALHFGFWVMLTDFLSFLASILLSFAFYPQFAGVLRNSFALSAPMSNLVAFLALAIFFESVLSHLMAFFLDKLIARLKGLKVNKLFAIIPGLLEAVLVSSFLLNIALIMPIFPAVKATIADSYFGSRVIEETVYFEAKLRDIFGGVVTESINYLTVNNEGAEKTIVLPVTKNKLSIDEDAERLMIGLVNSERTKAGVKPLSISGSLTVVSRGYATDMWDRHYFGHNSPEGDDVTDRLKKEGVRFRVAGENLALAPTVVTAHTGLMNSEGHRRNILDPDFAQMGIGVIDNGIYGKMFVQVFTD